MKKVVVKGQIAIVAASLFLVGCSLSQSNRGLKHVENVTDLQTIIPPVVEYVDVDVPECVEEVKTIEHRPACEVCGKFSVTMRSHAGPVRCGQRSE